MVILAKIKTKQQTSSITQIEDGTYYIKVRAQPINNQANIEVIKTISNHFNIPQSKITIQTGKTSKMKRIILEEK